MRHSDQIACVLTGHLLKDPGAVANDRIVEIDADIGAVERALSQSGAPV